MKLNTLFCGAVMTLGIMSTGAFAADADMSCADFTKMDATGQAKIIADMGTTPSLTATTAASTDKSTTATPAASTTAKATTDNKTAALPTLSAGVAVSACQATPTATVQAALSKAGYTIGAATMTK